jgi:hypothetical protein
MKDNKHTQSVPADKLAQALALANDIHTLISPYVTSLSPDDRRNLPKMGEKSVSFVDKTKELATLNPTLCPSFMNLEDFVVDYSDARSLTPLLVTLNQVTDAVSDTQLLAGSEAYQAALTFYKAVKFAASQNVDGAKAIYEALKVRFPQTNNSRRKSGEEASE